jgi:hypothetical protein
MVSFAHLRLPGDWYRLPNGTREGGKGTRNVARRHAGRRQRPTASDLRTDSDPIRRLSDGSSGNRAVCGGYARQRKAPGIAEDTRSLHAAHRAYEPD